MKPEAAYVFALSRGELGGVRAAAASQLDSDRVCDLAARHQVDALCSWMWKGLISAGSVAPCELPAAVERHLRQAYLHNLLRNELLINDLAAVYTALASRGIEALYFKGPWLMLRAYPDPGTRPVGDIDLGVRDNDYHGALAALQTAGYAPDGALPDTAEKALSRAHYGRQLRFSARGRRPLELHFRLVNVGPPVDERWIWQTARDLPIGPCTLRVPGPEAMLLHLIINANQHAFAVLRLLHDIRWALASDGASLDAAAFVARVCELHCEAPAYHALLLAQELAGATIPVGIQNALRPYALRRIMFARVWRLGAARRLEAPRRQMQVESPLLYLLEMGRMRDKARYVAGLLAEAGGPGAFLTQTLRVVSRAATAGRGGTR